MRVDNESRRGHVERGYASSSCSEQSHRGKCCPVVRARGETARIRVRASLTLRGRETTPNSYNARRPTRALRRSRLSITREPGDVCIRRYRIVAVSSDNGVWKIAKKLLRLRTTPVFARWYPVCGGGRGWQARIRQSKPRTDNRHPTPRPRRRGHAVDTVRRAAPRSIDPFDAVICIGFESRRSHWPNDPTIGGDLIS